MRRNSRLKLPLHIKILQAFYYILPVIYLLISHSVTANELSVSNNGVLDLSDYNFEQQGNISLNGEWKFFNEKLLNNSEVKKDSGFCVVSVPQNLKGQDYDGQELDVKGYGTYYLQVIVNKKYTNELFLLDTKRISTASKVFVNGKLVGHNGLVSALESISQPSLIMTFNEFNCHSDTLNIVIHVSNYHTQKFGLFYKIDFGLSTKMHRAKTKSVAVKLFAIGGIFLVMLNFLVLYLLRRKDKTSLYFVIMAFFAFVYVLRLSGVYFALVSSLGYEINYKVQMIGAYFFIGMLLVYVSKIFPFDFSKKILHVLLVVTLLFILSTLVFSVKINSHFLTYFNYYAVISFVYILFVVIKSVVRKRDGAVIFLVGISLFFLTVVNDFLSETQVMNGPTLFPVGLFLFLFSQVIFLSVKYTRSFSYTEKLSQDLAIINKNLENIVDERTQEIKNKNHELVNLGQFKHDMINMLAHDLKNLLHVVVNVATNKQVKHAGYVMHNLIMNFLDINKSENAQLILHKSEVDLIDTITKAIDQIRLIAEQKSIIISNKVGYGIKICIDEDLILRVLVNLISNAIKYSPIGKEVKIESSIICEGDSNQILEVCVTDYGEGISFESQDKVFDKYCSDGKETGTIRSTGLGLAFCKMAVEAHDCAISVKSEKGVFTTFCITLPMLRIQGDSIQSADPFNQFSFNLSEGELKYLKPFGHQLNNCKIYQVSDLRNILNAINGSQSEQINLWKNRLEQAIYNCNNSEYEYLIHLLNKD